MSAISQPLDVTIGGVHLTGEHQSGFWEIDEFEGWWGAPASRGEGGSRSNADGDFSVPMDYGPRYIKVIGAFVASDPGFLVYGMNQLSGLLSAGPAAMTVSFHGETTTAVVERMDPIEPRLIANRLVEFDFQIKAPDPRKLGQPRGPWTLVPGQAIQAWHRGNYDAYPVVTVTGSFPNGYTINGPGGKKFVVTENPGSGTHTLDMRNGLLRIGSNYWTGHTGQSDVWSVPVGKNVAMSLTATGASGTASVSLLDTYI